MATIQGSSGSDNLNGTNEDDTITNGGGGSDTINGNGGNDRIVLTGNFTGATTIDGGAGNDTVAFLPDDGRNLLIDIGAGGVGDGQSGGQSFTNVEGFETGGGDDTFVGTSGSHYMSSGAGNDTLTTNGGSDTIDAGSGDDIVTLNGNFSGASTTIEGGTGNDTIILDSNEDYDLIFDMNTGSLGDGMPGTDTITGFENVTTDVGNDSVTGTSGANQINTGAGNDTVDAGAGNDTVRGASGDDSIEGGAGDDLLIGGHDVTTGELFTNGDFATGDLTGWTSTGQVRMDGERPNIGATTISDTSDGSLSQTINTLPGETYGLTLDAFWRGASTNSGSNNTFEILVDGVVIFTDTSNGTINTSALFFVATGDTTEIEFRYTDNDSNGSNGGLTIDNVSVVQNAIQDNDTIDGGDGADTIYGNDGADGLTGGANDGATDRIFGGAGDDVITSGDTSGTPAGDVLAGGTGADTVTGGSGDDTILGGAGADSISAGAGADLIYGDSDLRYTSETFNNGSTEGWTATLGTLTLGEGVGTDGSDALVFDDTGSGLNFLIAPSDFLTNLTSQGDLAQATLSFDINIVNNIDFILSHSISITGDGETITLPFTLAATAGVYQTVTIDLLDAAAAGVTEARLQEILQNITDLRISVDTNVGLPSGDDAYIDNITLTTLPAPGTNGDNDIIDAGDGADTVYGEGGNDVIDGGGGADSIFGGEGSDTILLGDSFGSDTVVGGEDADNGDVDVLDASNLTEGIDVVYSANPEGGTLTGRNSGDVATFSEIENIVYTDQDDTADASAATAAVNISTGNGADSITTGAYGDTVDAGDGDDQITIGGSLTETGQITSVDGGAGNDTLILDPTDDRDLTVDMSAGTVADGIGGTEVFSNIENITTAAGNDNVTGDTGANVITTNDGADTIAAGGGDDTVLAGAGNDSIDGGAGDDSLTGGLGNDTFVVSSGNDTITDFNTGNTGALDDGDNTNNDAIDLSAYYDNIWELRADQEDDGILNQSNDGNLNGADTIDYSDNAVLPGSLTFSGATGADSSFFTAENTGVVCFAEGTLIETPRGEVPVEELQQGDLVNTLDQGAQPIVWSSHTRHSWDKAPHAEKPIEIKANAFGPGLPKRTLRVSPQHKILACTHPDPNGVFIPAKALTKLPGIREMKGCRSVSYHHMMLNHHHVLISEGMPTESFYPGPMAIKSLHPQNRIIVKEILDKATNGKGLRAYPHARPELRVRESVRLLKQGQLFWSRPASIALAAQ